MKKVEKEVSIAADAATVWRALTEAEELKKWFPLEARVTPGVGGSIWVRWDEGGDWEAPIEVWEPERHLRTGPSPMAIDYYIEATGGETVLRLVQSGFGDDAWDDELETLESGWGAFLAQLKHYLEHHRGKPRTTAFMRHPVVPLSRPEAFARVLAAFGVPADAEYKPGDRYALVTADGDRFEGEVRVFARPVNLSGTVENWGDAWIMIEIEPGRGQCRPAVWVSLYGDAGAEAGALQQRLQGLLTRTFSE